jgi:hypothetical protein
MPDEHYKIDADGILSKQPLNLPDKKVRETILNAQMRKLIELMETNPPATDEAIKEAEDELGMAFPKEYREFMLESNGVEGRIGQNSYLAIWPDEEIVQANKDYKIDEFTPGLVYFATDSGSMAYAFDKRCEGTPIMETPDDSIHIEEAVKIADTFTGFLQYLYDYED